MEETHRLFDLFKSLDKNVQEKIKEIEAASGEVKTKLEIDFQQYLHSRWYLPDLKRNSNWFVEGKFVYNKGPNDIIIKEAFNATTQQFEKVEEI